jgi:four helix bundle protein
MAPIIRFEDIEGWKKARELARAVYQAVASTPLARDFGLHDQMQRAAVLVMANIAEGFGRGGNRGFILFLGHARGSCAELKSHFYVALDAGMLAPGKFDYLYRLAGEAEGLVSDFMKYLQNSASRGRKFKNADNREP